MGFVRLPIQRHCDFQRISFPQIGAPAHLSKNGPALRNAAMQASMAAMCAVRTLNDNGRYVRFGVN
jgi:hypothetical protein